MATPIMTQFVFSIIGVAMAWFLVSTTATRVSRQCGSGPGGQEIQESTRSPKKNTPRDTETTGQSPKIREKVGFPTDLGIDRLHPEPKNDFLCLGSTKRGQIQQKTSKNVENPGFLGRGVWARFSALFFLLKGLPIRPRGVGGMGRSREMRRGNQPLPPDGVSDHRCPTARHD